MMCVMLAIVQPTAKRATSGNRKLAACKYILNSIWEIPVGQLPVPIQKLLASELGAVEECIYCKGGGGANVTGLSCIQPIYPAEILKYCTSHKC